MRARKNNSKKLTVVLLSVILVLCCTIGGTLAWLTDETPVVTNTFSVGNVTLTLKESPINVGTDGSVTYGSAVEDVKNEYPALPGSTYKKDPVVQIDEGSEKCYLFVKFEYTSEASTYYTFDSVFDNENSGWKKMESAPATGTYEDEVTTIEVWYRVVDKNAAENERTFKLLADLGTPYGEGITLAVNANAVTNDTVEDASAQKLEYTAYAVQYDNVTDENGNGTAADEAWALLNPTASTT